MRQEITFMPLGGGQRVGASCYYLRIGEANIILDAGTGKEKGIEFEPAFHSLLTSPFVQSMSQINQIFISHAHSDHVGYLLKLMKQACHSSVYMTEITRILSGFQLYDRNQGVWDRGDEDARLAAQSLLGKITTVSYMQTMDFGKYRVTFFPAGHIPGSMMTLFDTGNRKILYTGDYSLKGTVLAPGCMIPRNVKIDTVIMCGLHAKHPGYTKRSDALNRKANMALRSVETSGRPLKCYLPQLSKGIEFLKILNQRNTAGIPIYLDNSVMDMVVKMERLSVPVLNRYNKMIGDEPPKSPHIYLTANPKTAGHGLYRNIRIDFSLHDDFGEMKRFIKQINPKQAVIVHCGRAYSDFSRTIEQEMMQDADCRTQFIFAEEKEIYKL